MKYAITTLAIIMAGVLWYPANGQVAFTEDFESITIPALPASWTQTKKTTSVGWKTHSGAIKSSGNWVMPAHTQFAVIDDWNLAKDTNNPSILITPVIDISALNTPFLTFEYYFIQAAYNNGGAKETATVMVTDNGGTTWHTLGALDGNSIKWQKAYMELSVVQGSSNVQIGFQYEDENAKLIGVGIDDIKIFDPPTNDIQLASVSPVDNSAQAYATAGKNFTIGGTVFNNGATPITSFVVKYQQGTSTVVSDNITGVNIAPFTTYDFTTVTPLAMPSTLGHYNLDMWVELAGDANQTNDSGKTSIEAVVFIPQKKILAEEGTGTWCGWCPRGHVYMDSVAHSATYNKSFSLTAVHNGDPMTVSTYDSKIGSLVSGYPSLVIDRREVIDPSELIGVYDEQKDNFGFAEITMTDIPVSGLNYSVKVSVKPAMDLNGTYRLALVLTEDDVHGTGNGWDQANYYSFQVNNLPLVGAGLNWQTEPSHVPAAKMYYNHVARAIYPNPDGAVGSLPATMTAGSTYDYTFNVSTKYGWNRDNNKMHAIVMLIRGSDGHVINTQNADVPLGLSDVNAGIDEFRVFPNPANDIAFVNFSLAEKANVKVMITDAIGRVVAPVSSQAMGSGAHKIQVDLSTIPTGVYNVTLQTEKGNISHRLSIVK